ncbi:MAG: 2-amino-4-hydroxy-6-hydroxymethyldihydropteridine diphosphokinase [candidate division Zixibacteria bacterium]|nr:2-amino-4-hydroxy-6-hydroxymethyldihydropteridine diphosphokinase [candidate division Zixibacteria bacterium]
MAETVYILLGSNAGDREKNLTTALNKLETLEGFELVATSPVYITEARDMPVDSPNFLNQVVKGDYKYTPRELLNALELIEKNLGRTGKGKKEPRPIDLDILFFGEQIIATGNLTVPHPEVLNRPFAMVPLLDIDPQIIHPVTKEPVADFLDENERKKIILYKDHVARNI